MSKNRNTANLTDVITAGSTYATVATPPQFDNSTNLATTAFMQRASGNYSSVSSVAVSTALTAAAAGTVVSVTATGQTITLPAAATCPSGSAICITYMQSTGSATVARNGTDTLSYGQGNSGVNTLTLSAGESIEFVSNGTNAWISAGQTLSTGVTPAQFNNSLSLATTASIWGAGVQYGGVTVVTAPATLTVANAGKMMNIAGSAASSVTLPSQSTFPVGTTMKLYNGSGFSMTINRAGTDVIAMGNANVNSLVMGYGDTLTLVSANAGFWIAIDGSSQLAYSGAMVGLNANSGYQRLPNGVLIQWGLSATSTSGTVTASFPIAFTTSVWTKFATVNTASASTNAYTMASGATGGLTSQSWYCSSATSGIGFQWLVIGF